MITFACSACARQLRAAESAAGKKARCPRCGAVTPIPAPATAPVSSADGVTLPPGPAPDAPTLMPPPNPDTLPPLDSATAGPGSPTVAIAPGQIPGYELLGELGRGGMGVILKARQQRPRRLVALKMILAGSYAGAEQVARFKTEAESVARLQHPNIVQVFEVGEHEGKPYLTLEYIAGGTLAQAVAGKPLRPKLAAEMVRQLALAVQYAHKRGIVHRDLKPANILLQTDEDADLASAVPKITDFGLAKPLEDSGSLAAGGPRTNTGAILGTPSYMAPEQADGKGGAVGPLADVYALGAILYECLTGKPPFQAPTPLDTILKVVSEEPVAPSRLRPKVPRDLEKICLNCLRKEPKRRYASAGALAEDLRRYLAGEPISARPPGKLERLGRFLKRRREVVYVAGGALAAVLAVVLIGVLWPSSGPVPRPTTQLDDKGKRLPQPAPVEDPADPKEDPLLVAARRSRTMNQMKQIGIAVHGRHDMFNQLPVNILGKDGRPLLSWRVAILPLLEQGELYKRFDLNQAWDHPTNLKLLSQMPKVFAQEWKNPAEPFSTYFQAFSGPGTPLEVQPGGRGLPLTHISDGTSKTILLVESGEPVPWTKPQDLPFLPGQSLPRVGGVFPGGFHATMMDGSVRFINRGLKEETLRAAITRNGAEILGEDWERASYTAPGQSAVGQVMRQDQPVPGALVVIHAYGAARTLAAQTDDRGSFVVMGVPEGKHKVTVRSPPGSNEPHIPDRYGHPDTTPVRITVSDRGGQVVITLTDQD